MGPRSVERGNLSIYCGSYSQLELQWGRVRLNAETRRGGGKRRRSGGRFNGAAFG